MKRRMTTVSSAIPFHSLRLRKVGDTRRLAGRKVKDMPGADQLAAAHRLLPRGAGAQKTEQFRILFLDRKNVLIADEVQQRGTIDHRPVYRREVIKRALTLNAAVLILVHNHHKQALPSTGPLRPRSQTSAWDEGISAMGHQRTLTVVVNWPLHGASQSELRSQPIRCANAEWHLAACHLALPKLSISPMRPQLQEPQTARCVTLVTQARRVGVLPLVIVDPCTGFKGDEPRAIPSRCDRWVGDQRYDFRRWTMDGPTPSRAIKNSGMPVCSSLVLSTAFHVSIIFALLWSPPTTSTPLMPEDAIEVTIERQTTSLAAIIQSVAIPEPPVDSPPIQPALPVPRQPVPQVESAQTPTLENAVPEPEPAPELTLRDFPKAGIGCPQDRREKAIPQV